MITCLDDSILSVYWLALYTYHIVSIWFIPVNSMVYCINANTIEKLE